MPGGGAPAVAESKTSRAAPKAPAAHGEEAVALGLPALLAGDRTNNRAPGPDGAIGIDCAALSALATRPAVPTPLGAAYRPSLPKASDSSAEAHGVGTGRRGRLVLPPMTGIACWPALAAAVGFLLQIGAIAVHLTGEDRRIALDVGFATTAPGIWPAIVSL